jgi:hypothetical protein
MTAIKKRIIVRLAEDAPTDLPLGAVLALASDVESVYQETDRRWMSGERPDDTADPIDQADAAYVEWLQRLGGIRNIGSYARCLDGAREYMDKSKWAEGQYLLTGRSVRGQHGR